MIFVDWEPVDDDIFKVVHVLDLIGLQICVLISQLEDVFELVLLLRVEVIEAGVVLIDGSTIFHDLFHRVLVLILDRVKRTNIVLFSFVFLKAGLLLGYEVVPTGMVLSKFNWVVHTSLDLFNIMLLFRAEWHSSLIFLIGVKELLVVGPSQTLKARMILVVRERRSHQAF